MPIIDDPSIPNPLPPEVVQSPDGKLAAWTTSGGIQLRANFQDLDGSWDKKRTNLSTNPSLSHTSDLVSGGGAALSTDSSWSVSGSTSVKVTPSGTDSASAVYFQSAANRSGMVAGGTYTMSATIKVNQAQSGTLNSNARKLVVGYRNTAGVDNYNYATSIAAANTAGTVIRLSVTVTWPMDFAYEYVRGMNGSAVATQTVSWDAILIEESATVGNYFDGDTPSTGDMNYVWLGESGHSPSLADPSHAVAAVRFLRDELPVRSGNDRVAVAAVANAFDHETPLGSSVTYKAYPVNAAGELGTPTDSLSISTPNLPAAKDVWIKSISDPSFAMQVEVQGDPEVNFDGRDTLTAVQGSSLMAGGVDTMVASARTLTLKTYTVSEMEQLVAILSPAWVLLVQLKTSAGIRDYYCTRGQVGISYFVGSQDPQRLITVELKPTLRPSPVGAPLVIPGHSYDDTQVAAITFNDRLSTFPEYQDTLGIPVEVTV